MEYNVEYRIEESLPDGTPTSIKLKKGSKLLFFRATRNQAGTGDWTYEVDLIDRNGRVLAQNIIPDIVIPRPLSVIDLKTRKGNILQIVGDAISKYENTRAQTVSV